MPARKCSHSWSKLTMKVKRYALLKENSSSIEEKFMLLSLNSLMFVVFEKRQWNDEIFFVIFAKWWDLFCHFRAKDTRAMSSCLLGLLVHRCTRAHFAQNLLLINLFVYAIVINHIFCYRKNFLYLYNLFKAFDYCNCVSFKYREYKDPSSTKF